MSKHKLEVVAGMLAVIAAAVGLITAVVTAKGGCREDQPTSEQSSQPARVAAPKTASDLIPEHECRDRAAAGSVCVPSEGNAWAVNEQAENARLKKNHAHAECFARAAACRALYGETPRDDRVVAASLYELAYANINNGQSARAVPLLLEAARLRARAGNHRALKRVCELLHSAHPAPGSPDCPEVARTAN